jgi:cytochrome c peroxidase
MRAAPIACAVLWIAVVTTSAAGRQTSVVHLDVPLGLDRFLRVPDDNPITPAKAALGRRLFFDTALSADRHLSCATCHDPARAFADDRPVAVGIDGRHGTRNTPSLVNRGWGATFFWDGRAPTLEAQVLQPIANPDELGFSSAGVVDRLATDIAYAAAFREVFGRDVSADDVARALATYVRTIRAGDSAWDRYRAGDRPALSAEARLGLRVFGNRGLCTTCHLGPTLTDERFHNTGVAWDGRAFGDEGRFAVTGLTADRGAFRTPSLRHVADTAPYMHDGSLATLDAVVDFYDAGGRPNPQLDSEILPLGLSAEEKAGLEAFLRALSGAVVDAAGPAVAAGGGLR